ncbi:UvrD-helicase domain-containing protein [Saccharospirillum alexandrii]|uniref:UvrD-helicase domain-containing protein n=1 Tax=Saccharospirillum alexandrii TaxID=2448477 RepID=UPI003735C65C
MDKRIILAVAGSGKTSHIIDGLSREGQFLILTYTENNYNHLQKKVIEKFGIIPENITVLTYFTFLYSFCYKPFLYDAYGAKGINWEVPPVFTLRLSRSNRKFYVDTNGRLYSNRIAKILEVEGVLELIKNRLEKYFDHLLIDEIQDFGGHDFNLLKQLCAADVNMLLVGDFYQHTFDTSRDGKTNQTLHNDIEVYKKHFSDVGFVVDLSTLSDSHRCTSEVCDFVTEYLGIKIGSNKCESSNVVFVEDPKEIARIFYDDNIIKLFYRNHSKYPCESQNWGKSKGLDNYQDVCVVLYKKAAKEYRNGKLHELPPSSKNKLYVACTRANNDLYIIEEDSLMKVLQ